MLNRVDVQSLRSIVRMAVVGFGCLLLVGALPGRAAERPPQKALTNEDVVSMVQAGLSQEVVIEKIKTSKTAFDTSTEGLVALKKAGVGSDIIRMMVNPSATASPGGGGSPLANPNSPVPCQVPPGGG